MFQHALSGLSLEADIDPFIMEPSGRTRLQIGPTTGSGFCLDAASRRSSALSFRSVAAG